MTVMHRCFGRRGWKGISQALQFDNRNVCLESLRIEPRFFGPLGTHLYEYLRLLRSTGTKHHNTERFFAEFNRFVFGRKIDSVEGVTTKVIAEWISSMTCGQATCRAKVLTLKRFFQHQCSLGIISNNPVTHRILESIGTSERTFEPYIFSHEQIRIILHETKQLTPNRNFTLKPQAVHTIISLLYTLGLRVSEALHLHIRDVDFEQQTLFVRKTKFYKERIVPFGPKLGKCLMEYLALRRTVFVPARKDDPVFVARRRAYMSETSLGPIFRNILNKTQINAGPRQKQPRLHDLRHSFAVHRLLRWYEQGEDVQSKLVLLSTFMGHVEIYSTQVYLTIIESLLHEANRRFYREFGTYCDRKELP
jgi:site-specific recombinase XerD